MNTLNIKTIRNSIITITLALIPSLTILTSISTAQAGIDLDYIQEHIVKNIDVAPSYEEYLLQRGLLIQRHLANKEFANIISFIHPTKGVRFSMYAYVDPKTDKVFNRRQFTKYLTKDRIKFTWGEQDGTGDLYIATLPNYLNNWVRADTYQAYPFTASVNAFQGRSNSLNNLKAIYPNQDFVELHNSGVDPKFEGMDWRSLRLVFEPYQGDYYLVAIITDEWTI